MNKLLETNVNTNNTPVTRFKKSSPPCGTNVINPRSPVFIKSNPRLITWLFTCDISDTGCTKNSQLSFEIHQTFCINCPELQEWVNQPFG